PIFIEGRLKLDTWEDRKDGSKRSKLRVVVENFQFVDTKKDSGGEGGGGYERAAPTAKAEESFGNDDIPF
ncbi:MAG: single-stranded DNA-binding protein, partial [Planctomycetes bacterium]|nr:single-stranded DNA-binding protein [Planctomycetota bacterium]